MPLSCVDVALLEVTRCMGVWLEMLLSCVDVALHGCMVYTEHAETAAVSCGASHASIVITLLSCVYVALLEVRWCMVVWLEMLLSCVYVALLEVRWCMVVWWIQNMRQQQFHMVSAMPAL